jgi:thiamin-phosphate kinase
MLPVGKLPLDLLARLLDAAPSTDPRVLLGPGIGLDCAVVDFGEKLLVLKSDPITFATEEIGWYAVQINANDIATTGARPRWMLVTLLLPEGKTTPETAERIAGQVYAAAQAAGVTVIGGHTEITFGLDRPILSGTMIGEVEREKLITPQGARPGDRLLLTKGVPIEGAALLALELPERLSGAFSPAELEQAARFLHDPGISVLREAQIAVQAGKVTAMHDPTEGGLAAALWELAAASGCSLAVDLERIPVLPLAARMCAVLGLNPLACLASGALLLAARPEDAASIQRAVEEAGILCAEIGAVEPGPPAVWSYTSTGRTPLPRPERDEIARLFET